MDLDKFLYRFKLIDHIKFKLTTDLDDFVSKLSGTVDKEKVGHFRKWDEYYSKSKSIYVGEVNLEGFYIRNTIRRQGFLPSTKVTRAYASGTFLQQDSKVLVDVTIKGYSNKLRSTLKLLLIVYLLLLAFFFVTVFSIVGFSFIIMSFFLVVILFQLSVIVIIAIHFMQDGVRNMKESLPYDFFEISQTQC